MTISVANFILGFIVFLALVTAGVVIIKAQSLKTTADTLRQAVDSWRQEAEAQESRGDRLEKANERLETEFAILQERMAKVEAANATLTGMAQGAPELRALMELLHKSFEKDDARHDENVAHLSRLEGGVSRLETGLLKTKE